MMRIELSCLLLMTLLLACRPTQGSQSQSGRSGERQSITLCDEQGYRVRLNVAKRASLADVHWLTLELENKSGAARFVGNLHYRIEYSVEPAGKGSWRTSGLCSGSMFQVFARERPAKLERGTVRSVTDPVYRMASRSLGYWPGEDIEVSAVAHFSVSFSHGSGSSEIRIGTPVHGVPFQFLWGVPERSDWHVLLNQTSLWVRDATFEQNASQESGRYRHDSDTRRRLNDESLSIGSLLEAPPFVELLSDEYLHQLAELETFGSVRFPAMRCLFERDPDYQPYIREYARRLESPRQIFEMKRTGFWHPGLVESLIQIMATPHDDGNTSSFHQSAMALRLLEEHRSDWEHDASMLRKFEAGRRAYRMKAWWRRLGSFTVVTILTILVLWIAFIVRRRRQRASSIKADGDVGKQS